MGVYFIGDPLLPQHVMEFKLFGPATIRPATEEEVEKNRLLDRLAHVPDHGEWWLKTRWGGELPAHDPRGRLSDEDLRAFLAAFQSVFDNAWYRSAANPRGEGPTRDPMGMLGAQNPAFRILRLGECMSRLGGETSLHRELVKRLRGQSQHWQAATELEVACCFKEAGFEVDLFPRTVSGSRPDGRVISDGQTVYYEVTEQNWSSLQRTQMLAEDLIVECVRRRLGSANGVVNFPVGWENPMKAAGDAAHYLERRFLGQDLPVEVDTPTLRARFWKPEGAGGWLQVTGLEPEPRVIVERWVVGLFGKARQLPAGRPGVIIGSPLFLWGPHEVTAALTAVRTRLDRHPHRRISGFILAAKHVESSGFMKHVPQILVNPWAETRCDEVLGRMGDALFRFPDWM